MNTYKMLSVTIFVALAQNAFASIDSSETIASPSVEVLNAPQSAQTTPMMRDGIFKAVGEQVDADGTKYLDFVPEYVSQNGKIYQNFDEITLSDKEAVAVKFREDGLVDLTMQLDDAEAGQEPSKAILTQEQFAKLNLAFDKVGDVAVLERDYSKYDQADLARRHGGGARHRSHGRHRGYGRMHYTAANGHSYTGCVAYVASRVGFSGTAGNGTGMASALVAEGRYHWNYGSPSVGDVCSYSGGRSGAGDVCIYRGGDCCEYDKGCHSLSMRGYHLKHCASPGGGGGWGMADSSGGGRRHHRRHR